MNGNNSILVETSTVIGKTNDNSEVMIDLDKGERFVGQRRFDRCLMVLYFLVFALFINVIALYSIHFEQKSDIASSAGGSTRINLGGSAQVSGGQVVSLDANGKLNQGAGISLYQNIDSMNEASIHQPMFTASSSSVSSKNVLSYYSPEEKSSIVRMVDIKTNSKTGSYSTSDSESAIIKGYKVIDSAKVDDKNIVYVLSSTTDYTLALVKAEIKGSEIKIATDKIKSMSTGTSLSGMSCALQDGLFALVKYEDYIWGTTESWTQYIIVGKVSGDSIQVSDELSFASLNVNSEDGMSVAESTTFGQPMLIPGSVNQFVVPWYSKGETAASGLCMDLLQANTDLSKPTKKFSKCLTNYQPQYFIDTVSVRDNLVAAVFFDGLNSNALTISIIEVSGTTLTERHNYIINGVGAGKFDSYTFPKVTIEALRNSRFALAFSNPNNNAEPSVHVIEINSRNAIIDLTPSLVISKTPIRNIDGWKSPTYNIIPVSENALAVVYSTGNEQSYGMSVCEIKPSPIGVVSQIRGSDQADIATNGIITVSQSLSVGKTYYATSTGKLVTGQKTPNGYIKVDGQNIVVSESSRIGKAVSSNLLSISTA